MNKIARPTAVPPLKYNNTSAVVTAAIRTIFFQTFVKGFIGHKMRTRNNRIVVYLNDEELNILNKNVQKTGLTKAVYLRKIIQETVPNELPSVEHFNVLHELRKIGGNIHQVAIKANALGFIDAPMYRKNYEDLQDVVGKIMSTLYP